MAAIGSDKVERAIAALAADWERQEGVLRRPQVERLVMKRRLSVEESVFVFKSLERLGIELENPLDSESPKSGTLANQEPEKSLRFTADDFLPSYFQHRLLSTREEIELGRAIQIGALAKADLESGVNGAELLELIAQGNRARNRLVEANLRLVFSVAQKIKPENGLDLTDMVQDGTLGLLRAAELFDPDLGLKFSTYATHWIRQGIFRGSDTFGDTIRIPVHRMDSIRKFRRARRILSTELGRQAEIRDIADALDWTPEKTFYIQYLSFAHYVSLEAPMSGEDSQVWSEILESPMPNPEQLYAESERRRLIDNLLHTLTPRQRIILIRRFGLDNGIEETLQAIGDQFRVTRERIRQIEARALKRAGPKARSMGIQQVL